MTKHRHRLSTGPSDAAAIAVHHDYVWARLPYLVPMAAKIARTCRQADGCADLAGLLVQLRAVLLDHLDREERMLSSLAGEADPGLVIDRIAALHEEHLAVADLLERIRALSSIDRHGADDASAAERALHRELSLLDDHVRTQIVLEDRLLAARVVTADPGATCG